MVVAIYTLLFNFYLRFPAIYDILITVRLHDIWKTRHTDKVIHETAVSIRGCVQPISISREKIKERRKVY